jgi:hypothetical protein
MAWNFGYCSKVTFKNLIFVIPPETDFREEEKSNHNKNWLSSDHQECLEKSFS